MNNELKARLIAALESAIENASELKQDAKMNNDIRRYELLEIIYQDEINECLDLITELQKD